MSLWTDLLHSPAMALPGPRLWLCLFYFKEARYRLPLCVAACGQQLGCALQHMRAAQHPGACRVMHVPAFPKFLETDTLLACPVSLEPKATLSLQDRRASWLCLW